MTEAGPSIKSEASLRSQYTEFFCGWCAGCVETCILFPQSKLIFRQQLLGLHAKDAVAQLKSEGIGMLYRGLLPPLITRTTNRSLMFGMFSEYKRLLDVKDRPGLWSSLTLRHATAALLAGMTEASLCPLERIQVLLQTSQYHDDFRNTHEAFAAVRRFGLPEFYRGISLILLRNGMSNAIFFTMREPLREVILHAGRDPADSNSPIVIFVSNFVSGAILGASISTIFFPVNVVKHRMQSVLGTPFQSPLTVFRIVWAERQSLRGLFRGVHLNFTRSLMTWGITNSVYEFLVRSLR